MTATSPRSSLPAISDELLSAFLDGQVTAAESARVEQSQAQDAEVALRLDLLAETVDLLRQAPRLAVPRSFVLSEAQVLAAGGKVKARTTARPGGFWAWLGGLSPRVMPLATAAVALALLVVVGIDLSGNPAPRATSAPQAAMAPAPSEAATEAPLRAMKSAGEPQPTTAAEAAVETEAMIAEATPDEAAAMMLEAAPAEETAQIQAEASDETATLKSAIIEETPAPAAPANPPSLRLLELALAGLLALLAVLTLLARRARPV